MTTGTRRVTPILLPHVDWDTYTHDSRVFDGHKITNSIDGSQLKLTPLSEFAVSLFEFYTNSTDTPLQILNNQDFILDYIPLGCLITCKSSSTLAFIGIMNLNILVRRSKHRNKQLLFALGSIRVWRDLIIKLCLSDCNREVRLICCEVFNLLVQLGFKQLFAKYSCNMLDEQLYLTVR